MKITYTPNPLRSMVELDDQEKELFKLKLKIEAYEDMIYGAYFTLTSRLKDLPSLKALTADAAVQKAVKELDPGYWCADNNTSRLDAWINEQFEHYITELQRDHSGDCTAFPASCSKCHAERLVGVDTLKPYPGKSVLHTLSRTFSYKDGEVWKQRSFDEVLDLLKNGPAKDYLVNYHQTHLGV